MHEQKNVLITSTANPRIVAAARLVERKERQKQGRFLVEGLQALHMALDAGWEPREVFYCEALFAGTEAPALLQRFAQTSASLVPVAPHVLARLSEREVPQGLVASFALRHTALSDLTWHEPALIVVLDRIRDPGNLGTLMRTADAVGAAALLLLPPCVDPFDPRVVRASMGSLFNLPFVLADDARAALQTLRARGVRLVGADAHRGIAWGTGLWQGSVALVLGNEAQGLAPELLPLIGDWVHLPMYGKADSLNVAVAGGVLMYAWRQANQI